jgi:hypothetical protein
MRKLLIAFFLPLLLAFQSNPPSIKVYEKEEKVENLQRNGFAVLILLEKSMVEKAWSKKVKELGKVESRGEQYTVKEAVMPSISAQPVRLYSKVLEKSKQGVEVWVAVDLGTEFVTSGHAKKAEIERLLYDFALETYRADLAMQVSEAEDALSKSTKEYERSIATEQKIRNKKERNVEQKKELLLKLQENKQDSLQLVKDMEMNKLEQKQDSVEVVKMKKAVEIVKNKMSKLQ